MPTITDVYKDMMRKNYAKVMRDSIAKAFGVDAESLEDTGDTPPTPPKVMTPYDVLGVPTSAKADDITVAYRSLLKKHHPDTGDGDTTQLQRVRDAFALIGNAQKRERYDKAVKLLQKQESPHFESGVFTPPTTFNTGSPIRFSTGSAGVFSSGSIYAAGPTSQQRNGLRVGYQIPQIGGVVGRITRAFAQGSPSISSGIMYLVEIDATFPQWVLRAWQKWEKNLSDRQWWLDTLRLDPSRYTITPIRVVMNSPGHPFSYGQPINSLGAQIELEVIEL